MNIHKKNLWFTLVELVVVITILAILATLSFVSFTWYMSSTRDSKRSVDINNINKSFEITKITNGQVFFPDSNIDVTLSWSLVGNQWDIKEQTLAFLWVSNEAFDPLDNKPYQFFSNAAKTRFQVVSFFENIENSKLAYVQSAFANSEYKNRYPFYRGEGLGFLLNDNNEPIHWEEVIETAGKYELADISVGWNGNKTIKPLFSNSIQSTHKSIFVSGQVNIAANSRWVLNPDSCPENFVHVPWNNDLWQPPFCIWKYEASYSLSNNLDPLQTIVGQLPALDIAITNPLLSDCRGNGEWYHIMTLNEWLTIAKNIELQPTNWTSWIVGEGYVKTWNSWNNTSGFSWSSILMTGPSGNTTQDNLRQLQLSNGEIIWDFIWNAWEIIQPLSWSHITINEEPELYKTITHKNQDSIYEILRNYNLWIDYNSKVLWKDDIWNINDKLVYPMYARWAGSIYNVNWAISFFVGWDYNESLAFENWLFSLWHVTGYTYQNVSTRCAYSGN